VFGSEDVTPGPVEEPIPDRAGTEIIVVAPFMTNDLILEVIHSLKFRGYNALARPAARAIAWALRNGPVLPGEGSVLVPVPMDDKSLRHRGFNPAERIARELGRELGWPVADILRKSKRTRPQSKTPAEDRAANVRGVFAEGPGAGEPVKDRPVVLVDDLVTTGATAAACGSVLLAAGASRLSVACLGRTM
jgi:ComF family protein